MAETLTVAEARRRAHEHAMRTDAEYRRQHDRIRALVEARQRSRVAGYGDTRRTAYQRRLWSLDRLQVRAFMHGPRWRRHFGVREVQGPSVYGPRTILTFTLEDDVRELVLEELRPGVYAQWSDPREWVGVA